MLFAKICFIRCLQSYYVTQKINQILTLFVETLFIRSLQSYNVKQIVDAFGLSFSIKLSIYPHIFARRVHTHQHFIVLTIT